MKKKKSLSIKAAKKAVKENIKLSLITQLKEVTGKLGHDSKKLAKEIEKGSAKLAKRLVKAIDINVPAVVKTEEPAPAPAPKAAKAPKTKKAEPAKNAKKATEA